MSIHVQKEKLLLVCDATQMTLQRISRISRILVVHVPKKFFEHKSTQNQTQNLCHAQPFMSEFL